MLPPIRDLVPMQSDSSAACLTRHNTIEVLGRPWNRYLGYGSLAYVLALLCAVSLGLQPTLTFARVVTQHSSCSQDMHSEVLAEPLDPIFLAAISVTDFVAAVQYRTRHDN